MNAMIFIVVTFISVVIMAVALSTIISNFLNARKQNEWKKGHKVL